MASFTNTSRLYTDRYAAPPLEKLMGPVTPHVSARTRLQPYEDASVLYPTRQAPHMVRPYENVHTYPSLPARPHRRAHPSDFVPPDNIDPVPHVVDARDILDLSDQNVPLHNIERVMSADGRVTFYKYNRNTGTYTLYGTSAPPGQKVPIANNSHAFHRSDYFSPPYVSAPLENEAQGHAPDQGLGYVPDQTPLVF